MLLPEQPLKMNRESVSGRGETGEVVKSGHGEWKDFCDFHVLTNTAYHSPKP